MSLEQDLRRLSERMDSGVRGIEPTPKTRRRIRVRRSMVAVGAAAMVAISAVGAFALNDFGKESFPPATGDREEIQLGSGTYNGVEWVYAASEENRCLGLALDGEGSGCRFKSHFTGLLDVWTATRDVPREGFYTVQAFIGDEVADVKLASGESMIGDVHIFDLPSGFPAGRRVVLALVEKDEFLSPVLRAYDASGEKLTREKLELPPRDYSQKPPLPEPPVSFGLRTPTEDYEDLASFDPPDGLVNLFAKDATVEQAKSLRAFYLDAMPEAGWRLVLESEQAKKLKAAYAYAQVWEKDGIRATTVEVLGFADFLGYENLLKFTYGTCPPGPEEWCGSGE